MELIYAHRFIWYGAGVFTSLVIWIYIQYLAECEVTIKTFCITLGLSFLMSWISSALGVVFIIICIIGKGIEFIDERVDFNRTIFDFSRSSRQRDHQPVASEPYQPPAARITIK